MDVRRIMIVGGGAAGFFAAITAGEACKGAEIIILEKGSRFLDKVRISGGGRCNVTHACFDSREMTRSYPRGEKELIGALQRFQAQDTVAWFEERGVELKIESDGRMFPVTDSSQTIIDCLTTAAKAAGVNLRINSAVEQVEKDLSGGFVLALGSAEKLHCDKLLLATGGCRAPAGGRLAVSLGHSLEEPVPSLFTFHIATPWLRELAGISVEPAEVSVQGTRLRERGALLATHWGLSGPAILRLSAWGARKLHELNYKFVIAVDWLPDSSEEILAQELQNQAQKFPTRLVANSPIKSLPGRLWEKLVESSGISNSIRWANLSRTARQELIRTLKQSQFQVDGRSLNKDEFVTCGGVRLSEVNFKTMESKICPGLYFAGELLDIDGITGGFNFQAAWTTGWLAGRAMGL